MSKNRINLFLDIALAFAFVLVLEEKFTGQRLHELIGVGLAIGLVLHLILHLRWFITITLSFFRKLFHESRLSYILNLFLFADLLVIIVTGIGISRTLGLNLGLERDLMQDFERLHIQASNFSLLLVGLHVALHWKWIANHARRYIFRLPFHKPAAQGVVQS